jgi:hypothetical protein
MAIQHPEIHYTHGDQSHNNWQCTRANPNDQFTIAEAVMEYSSRRGSLWIANEEIDLAGLGEKDAILVECKRTSKQRV